MAEGEREFSRTSNPIHKDSSPVLMTTQKSHFPKSIILEIRFWDVNLGDEGWGDVNIWPMHMINIQKTNLLHSSKEDIKTEIKIASLHLTHYAKYIICLMA